MNLYQDLLIIPFISINNLPIITSNSSRTIVIVDLRNRLKIVPEQEHTKKNSENQQLLHKQQKLRLFLDQESLWASNLLQHLQ